MHSLQINRGGKGKESPKEKQHQAEQERAIGEQRKANFFLERRASTKNGSCICPMLWRISHFRQLNVQEIHEEQ
jgi:hypothetical protein